jgi:hypothetical protein
MTINDKGDIKQKAGVLGHYSIAFHHPPPKPDSLVQESGFFYHSTRHKSKQVTTEILLALSWERSHRQIFILNFCVFYLFLSTHLSGLFNSTSEGYIFPNSIKCIVSIDIAGQILIICSPVMPLISNPPVVKLRNKLLISDGR